MSSYSKVVRFDTYRTLAFGAISGAFAALGTPITHIGRILKFVNTTDGDITVSFDGSTNNDIVPAGSIVIYDFVSDGISNTEFVIQNGTQIYIKGTVSKGSFYAVLVYGQGE